MVLFSWSSGMHVHMSMALGILLLVVVVVRRLIPPGSRKYTILVFQEYLGDGSWR